MTDGYTRVLGVVTNVDGWPLPGIAVTALGAAGNQVGRGVTDAAGTFDVRLSAGGPLTLVASGAGQRPYAKAMHAVAGRTDAGHIVLGDTGSSDRPPPGIWDIDPAHTIVKATARHLGLTHVEGRFVGVAGRIEVGQSMPESSVSATLVAASLTTGNGDRDAHLKSPDFLDVERFPELRFESSAVRPGPAGRWLVDGQLTIRDIARAVTLELSYAGSGPDPWGGTRSAFTATTQLNRRDYEMDWNMGVPGGALLVGPTLRVDLEVQAILQVGS
jgi:polyisoprenoid-binding protein YceI